MRTFVVLALALTLVSCVPDPPHNGLMTDAEMIDLFQRERASFDSLAAMLDVDKNIGMLDAYAYFPPDAKRPISEERRRTYERLLRRVRCGRNIWSDENRILMQQFVQKYQADSRDNWMRGYWYARKPLNPGSTVTTEDLLGDRGESPGQDKIRYRHLSGSWYLYTDHGYSG